MNSTISSPKIYITIPAYNEGKEISSVVMRLKSKGFHNILVVNDGSKDDTEKAALDAGAEVLSHIINRGQGAALKTGIGYLASTYSPDVIITFDADGQHRVEDIPNMIKPVLEEGYDITLGSRFLDSKSNVPPLRKIILKAGIIFTNIISNIKLTDTHNGLRALGKNAFTKIEISHRGMEHASDIIDEIAKHKLRYKEVPVQIIYTDYSKAKGQSSAGFINMGIKILIKKLTS